MGSFLASIRKKRKNGFTESSDCYAERSHVQHHIVREKWGSNFSAPVQSILESGHGKVLDACCGPGTWVCENASDYTKARFWGVDIDPIFPTQKPFNVEFVKADVLSDLPFEEMFDFVHLRFIGLWFTEDQFTETILPNLLKVLRPHGWLEIMDVEYDFHNAGPLTRKVQQNVRQEMMLRNLNPSIANRLEEILRGTGKLQNITRLDKEMPVGTTQGIIGKVGGPVLLSYSLKVNVDAKHLPKADQKSVMASMVAEANLNKTFFRSCRFIAQKV